MAIIRIKRTTGSSLPTGLTFGEMAFVQGTGYTANRLYIADNAGVCVWVGAQILNSPTYWSGITAQTTVPTIQAVENRIVAGGGVTFSSDLSVNIDFGKYFGRYTRGDTIPALGKTVKEVIELALVESITPGISLAFSAINGSLSTIPFGQTSSISYTVTPSYQIKTVGATAAGATLEWRRTGVAGWTAYSGAFYDDTAPFTGTGVTFTVSAATGVTNNGLYVTTGFEYRYTVHDTAGASASVTRTVSVDSYGADPTVTSFVAGSPNLGTGESNAVRERGNSYSNITGTINRKNQYLPLTFWKLQFSVNKNGTWNDTNTPSAGWQTVSGNPSTVSINTNHTPTTTGLTAVDYRVLLTDAYLNNQGTTATATPSGQPGVTFGYKLFYGPTGSVPSTSAQIRGLPGVCMASGTCAAPNPFTLNTGTQFLNFVVALPENLTVTDIIDLDLLGGQSVFGGLGYNAVSDINVTDREGGTKAYNIYLFTAGQTYDANHRHQVSRTGTET